MLHINQATKMIENRLQWRWLAHRVTDSLKMDGTRLTDCLRNGT